MQSAKKNQNHEVFGTTILDHSRAEIVLNVRSNVSNAETVLELTADSAEHLAHLILDTVLEYRKEVLIAQSAQ